MRPGRKPSTRFALIALTVSIFALLVVLLVFNHGSSEGNKVEVDFNGYCTIVSSGLLCKGVMVNYMDSIAGIDKLNISYGGYTVSIKLTPPLIIKERTSMNIILLLRENSSYTLYSDDGVSHMSWRGVIKGSPSIKNISGNTSTRLVYRNSLFSYGMSGIIPFELNDYEFRLNASTGYFGVLTVNSSCILEYIDVKSMILHDRMSWELMIVSQSHMISTIPFQQASYPVIGSSELEGYPTRVTVEYYSRKPCNVSATLKVYSTGSVTLVFGIGTNIHKDYAPLIPPQYSENLWSKPLYLPSTYLPSHTLENPIR